MEKKIVSLTRENNGDSNYVQLFYVFHEDKTHEQFIEDYVNWKDEWLENNKNSVGSDDCLIDDYWEPLGYLVEYIVPDFDVCV